MRLGDALREMEVEEGPEGVRVRVDDRWHTISLKQIGHTGLYSLIVDDHPYEFFAEQRSGGFDIVIGSRAYSVLLEGRGRRVTPLPAAALEAEAQPAEWLVLSPMMGVVRQINVSAGDTVKAGDVLLVLEAMKMNNDLKAQRSGRVEEVYVSLGERVEGGRPLLRLTQD